MEPPLQHHRGRTSRRPPLPERGRAGEPVTVEPDRPAQASGDLLLDLPGERVIRRNHFHGDQDVGRFDGFQDDRHPPARGTSGVDEAGHQRILPADFRAVDVERERVEGIERGVLELQRRPAGVAPLRHGAAFMDPDFPEGGAPPFPEEAAGDADQPEGSQDGERHGQPGPGTEAEDPQG